MLLEIGKKNPNNSTEKKAKNIYGQFTETETQVTHHVPDAASVMKRKIQLNATLRQYFHLSDWQVSQQCQHTW